MTLANAGVATDYIHIFQGHSKSEWSYKNTNKIMSLHCLRHTNEFSSHLE